MHSKQLKDGVAEKTAYQYVVDYYNNKLDKLTEKYPGCWFVFDHYVPPEETHLIGTGVFGAHIFQTEPYHYKDNQRVYFCSKIPCGPSNLKKALSDKLHLVEENMAKVKVGIHNTREEIHKLSQVMDYTEKIYDEIKDLISGIQ